MKVFYFSKERKARGSEHVFEYLREVLTSLEADTKEVGGMYGVVMVGITRAGDISLTIAGLSDADAVYLLKKGAFHLLQS